jgi:hypothetical protein
MQTHLKFPGYQWRIPTLEEFVNGFSFQIYSAGYFEDSIEDFAGWYTYTMGENNWRDIDEIKTELKAGHIRVEI